MRRLILKNGWRFIMNLEKHRILTKKQTRFKISILQSDLFDYRDAYVVVKETITTLNPNDGAYYTKLAFKNRASCINCIKKIYNTLIDNAADLDIVMPMYNLIEYSKKYSTRQEVYGITTETNQIVVQ